MKSLLAPPGKMPPSVVRPEMLEPVARGGLSNREWRVVSPPCVLVSQPGSRGQGVLSRESGAPSVAEVMAAAGALGIDATCFARYAKLRWGSRWRRDATQRALALDEIRRYRNDAEGLADKVDTALWLAGRS